MLKLKAAREEAGLTQAEIASILGISNSFYSQLENGKRRLSLKMALDIAAILKKTPNELFLPCDLAKCQEVVKAAPATLNPTGTEEGR